MDVEIDFPIEFNVRGIPVASSAKRAESRDQWKVRVRDAARTALPEGHWFSDRRMYVRIYYFPGAEMQGDIDNIVKFILDALNAFVWRDDHQVGGIGHRRVEGVCVVETCKADFCVAE